MKMIREYWRRFEESVIVFASKLQNNLFLKTQVTFVAILLLIGIVNLGSLFLVSYHISEETVNTVFNSWGSMLAEEIPSPAFTVLELQEELEGIKSYYFLVIALINMVGVFVLGVIASKIALEPIRDGISAQKNFIGHTAHELRTPLSVARTNIEATLLDKERVSKNECIEELQRALIELDALAGIINNLVTLNTLTNLEPAEYHYHDLHPIITEVVESYHEFIESKQMDVSVESVPGLNVWSNRNALKQMIGNLVGNAINFTPNGGKVSIRAYQFSHRFIRLVVADTGIGIPKEELPLIFKPFYRTAAAKGREDGGSGLGLSIVRELVRLHLGRIGFQSTLGEGTTVTIDLPILRRRGKPTLSDRKIEDRDMVVFNFSRDKSENNF